MAWKPALVIAPHQFPDVERERQLAAEFGLELVVATNQDVFAEQLGRARIALITPYATVGEPEVARMVNAKGIVRYGIGYDNIDVASAQRAGIPVSIVPDASSEEVASHALALGLTLLRRIPAGQEAIREGRWASAVPADLPVLSRARIGVVGMGRIGRYVARWWSSLGAEVMAYDPFASFDEAESGDLDLVLTQSDVISLHVPLTDTTRHLVSAELIARMRPGVIVVNVSRGGLIDEDALASALRTGRVAGAGLDVFETEPLPADSPLRSAPNVMLTPHAAWKSSSSLAALQEGAVERARALLQGSTPRDLVSA